MIEDAATSKQNVSLEKFPLSSFDQLQKHGRIPCEKFGKSAVLLLIYLIQKNSEKNGRKPIERLSTTFRSYGRHETAMIACEMSANAHDYQQEYVLSNTNEHENTSHQAKNGKL